MGKIGKAFLYLQRGIQTLTLAVRHLYQGFRQGSGLARLQALLIASLEGIELAILRDQEQSPARETHAIQRLKQTAEGLHRLLPAHALFSYSILVPVYQPKPTFLKIALQSALDQSAPNMEVLVGFDGPQPQKVIQVVEDLQRQYPTKLKSFQLNRETEGGSISATTNFLANKAQGNFLLLMDHDDWIRPDLLLRYEQTLRLISNPDNAVLYCNEYKINEKGNPIPRSGLRKPMRPFFPYLFINLVCHCLLVPKVLWQRVGGLRIECNGAQDYDLTLRLDVIGAEFHHVPLFLYAWRSHSQSTAQKVEHKSYVLESGLRAVTDYVKAKKLDWKVEPGFIPTSYRAIPALKRIPTVHAVMLFKDQKELTLRTVQSLLKQQGVKLSITAVDNGSKDHTITQELWELGVEVLTIDEPFNFSRLNNLAVQRSRTGSTCESILFVNNDVELEEGAVEEMSRWIGQPKIGMVGCRLHYPNGKLQHGGIELSELKPTYMMTWKHTEKGQPFDAMSMTRIARVTDAVTAACALMPRQLFLEVGGFDELLYPIAYSDTSLAVKLRARGFLSFYTPYAAGIHHESVSRQFNHIEDYEQSRWLHQKFLSRVSARKSL